jgi:pimeloyl-ACP methyl ester carboxylesterase
MPGLCALYHPLQHGLALEEEADAILRRHAHTRGPLLLLGFSTGCTLAMYLARHPALSGRVRQVVLVGPACLQTMLDDRTRRWIQREAHPNPDGGKMESESAWVPIMHRRYGAWGAWWRWVQVAGWYWTLRAARLLRVPPSFLACLYHRWFGRDVEDPPAAELARTFFRLCPSELRTTVDQCLLRVDLTGWIRRYPGTVDVLVGHTDTYGAYSKFLFDCFGLEGRVRLHRAEGNHHMLFHRPQASALRLAAMLRLPSVV